MLVRGHRHFYVNKLASLHDGSLVIPLCWVIYKGEMCADAFRVSVNAEGMVHVNDSDEIFIHAADLKDNFYDLECKKKLPISWDSQWP
jgi:hypothetical protein